MFLELKNCPTKEQVVNELVKEISNELPGQTRLEILQEQLLIEIERGF